MKKFCRDCFYSYKSINKSLQCAHVGIKSMVSHDCNACNHYVERNKYTKSQYYAIFQNKGNG